MNDIHKAAGVIIRDRKLLFERSKDKQFFIAPGGSIEAGETAEQALVRELMEEFRIVVDEIDLEPFGTFSAEAANHPGRQVHMYVFVVKNWQGEPTPDNEVEEILWLDSGNVHSVPVGSIFGHEILPRLHKAGLIG